MSSITVTGIGITDKEQYEVKVNFEIEGKPYFCILNLSDGAFVTNLMTETDEEYQRVAHFLSHKAQEHFAEEGIELPPELHCRCH